MGHHRQYKELRRFERLCLEQAELCALEESRRALRMMAGNYEILVRGTPDGQLVGAHQIWATAFKDDATGEVLTVKHEGATPINLDDVKTVIPENFATLAQQMASLTAQLAEANATLRGLQSA
jgi:hypothetical protein